MRVIASLILGLAGLSGAEPVCVLDDQPKVIFYLSNSHKGTTGLQRHLDHAGFGHITVRQNLFGFLLKYDPKTGEWSSRSPLPGIKEEWRRDFPGQPAFIVYQSNEPAIDPLPAETAAREAALAERADWAARSDGAYFARMREMLQGEGFSDLYVLNHHYSKTAVEGKVDHPRWLSTIEEFNRLAGYELGVTTWPTTKPYYPRTVGFDYWHNNEFGRLAKTQPLIRAMAANSGLDSIPLIDLDQALVDFEAANLEITDITPVGEGQAYRVGDTIDIGWRMKDADLYPRVRVWLEIDGGLGKILIADDVLAANEHLRYTIPATAMVGSAHGKPRKGSVVDEQCRIRVSAALEKDYWVTNKSRGHFAIVAAEAGVEPAVPMAEPPSPLADNVRQVGDFTVRLARYPGFARAAIGLTVPAATPDLDAQLKILAEREHPDLVSVVVDAATVESDAPTWQAWDALGHEVVFAGDDLDAFALEAIAADLELTHSPRPVAVGYAPQLTPAVVIDEPQFHRLPPGQAETVTSHHLGVGSEPAMRAVIDAVLAQRGWALVTYDSVGEDFQAQVNVFHEFHDQLWNGPADRLLRYFAQVESVEFTVVEHVPHRKLVLEISDDLPDEVFHEPVSIQLSGLSHKWQQARCTQGGEERFCQYLRAKQSRVVRFTAVPDAGLIALER